MFSDGGTERGAADGSCPSDVRGRALPGSLEHFVLLSSRISKRQVQGKYDVPPGSCISTSRKSEPGPEGFTKISEKLSWKQEIPGRSPVSKRSGAGQDWTVFRCIADTEIIASRISRFQVQGRVSLLAGFCHFLSRGTDPSGNHAQRSCS